VASTEQLRQRERRGALVALRAKTNDLDSTVELLQRKLKQLLSRKRKAYSAEDLQPIAEVISAADGRMDALAGALGNVATLFRV